MTISVPVWIIAIFLVLVLFNVIMDGIRIFLKTKEIKLIKQNNKRSFKHFKKKEKGKPQ